jgi:alpha-1,3-rhamnosyl/mannosyltransferase
MHSIAEAMQALATNQALARHFVQKGLARAHMFTWEACAEKTLKVYEQVLGKA